MQLLILISIVLFVAWILYVCVTISVYGWKSDALITEWIDSIHNLKEASLNQFNTHIIYPGGYKHGYFVRHSWVMLIFGRYTVSSSFAGIESIVPIWYKSHWMLRNIEKEARLKKRKNIRAEYEKLLDQKDR